MKNSDYAPDLDTQLGLLVLLAVIASMAALGAVAWAAVHFHVLASLWAHKVAAGVVAYLALCVAFYVFIVAAAVEDPYDAEESEAAARRARWRAGEDPGMRLDPDLEAAFGRGPIVQRSGSSEPD